MIKDKIKIYQGGSTGLVQQKRIRTDSAKVKSSYIFKDIKDTLKDLHKIEVVFIQGGQNFHVIEEDAELIHKEFKWKKHDQGGSQPWDMCSCPATKKMEMFIVREIKKKSLSYAVLRQTDYTKTKVTRKVVATSNIKLLGMEF